MTRNDLAELLAREIERSADEDAFTGEVARLRYDKDREELVPCLPRIKVDGEIDCGKLADALLAACPALAGP